MSRKAVVLKVSAGRARIPLLDSSLSRIRGRCGKGRLDSAKISGAENGMIARLPVQKLKDQESIGPVQQKIYGRGLSLGQAISFQLPSWRRCYVQRPFHQEFAGDEHF
jgi:hypothetical protein